MKVPTKLTVIMRDESPLFINEPVTYRRVTIDLTPGQQQQLTPREVGTSGGDTIYEQRSTTFLE